MSGHLIHVGFPKAASNFLRRWFAAHPDIAFVHGGIAGYASAHALAAAPRDGPAPRWRVTSEESFVFPRPPGTAIPQLAPGRTVAELRAERCAELAQLFPNATILIVTRGFRSVLLSAYSQLIRSGGTADLAAMVEETTAGQDWHYDRVIAAYRAAFSDRVILLPFELISPDPAALTGELARKLDIAPHQIARDGVNPALSPAELVWYPALRRACTKLPGGQRLAGGVSRAVLRNRLRLPIAVLDRLWPLARTGLDAISDVAIDRLRGTAGALAADPLYRPYAGDYLF